MAGQILGRSLPLDHFKSTKIRPFKEKGTFTFEIYSPPVQRYVHFVENKPQVCTIDKCNLCKTSSAKRDHIFELNLGYFSFNDNQYTIIKNAMKKLNPLSYPFTLTVSFI